MRVSLLCVHICLLLSMAPLVPPERPIWCYSSNVAQNFQVVPSLVRQQQQNQQLAAQGRKRRLPNSYPPAVCFLDVVVAEKHASTGICSVPDASPLSTCSTTASSSLGEALSPRKRMGSFGQLPESPRKRLLEAQSVTGRALLRPGLGRSRLDSVSSSPGMLSNSSERPIGSSSSSSSPSSETPTRADRSLRGVAPLQAREKLKRSVATMRQRQLKTSVFERHTERLFSVVEELHGWLNKFINGSPMYVIRWCKNKSQRERCGLMAMMQSLRDKATKIQAIAENMSSLLSELKAGTERGNGERYEDVIAVIESLRGQSEADFREALLCLGKLTELARRSEAASERQAASRRDVTPLKTRE